MNHETWLACVLACRSADAADAAAGTATRRLRETTRFIDVSQPQAGDFLHTLPTSPAMRYRTDEWTWAMQRRFGLYVSAALPTFALLAEHGVTSYDPLGDVLTGESQTDKSMPHDAALRMWHDATQATAAHSVVMGDKSTPDLYNLYNTGCVVDLAEERMGAGGSDLCVEVKCWSSIVNNVHGPRHGTSFLGDTHAFGNTEERAIVEVLGVKERVGDAPWSAACGAGRVKAHRGDYHDALHAKRNSVLLLLHNNFGGFAPGAVKRMHDLSKRSIDRTQYESWTAREYKPYWSQRISGEIVTADSRRCLRRLPGLRRSAMDAARPATRRRTL